MRKLLGAMAGVLLIAAGCTFSGTVPLVTQHVQPNEPGRHVQAQVPEDLVVGDGNLNYRCAQASGHPQPSNIPCPNLQATVAFKADGSIDHQEVHNRATGEPSNLIALKVTTVAGPPPSDPPIMQVSWDATSGADIVGFAEFIEQPGLNQLPTGPGSFTFRAGAYGVLEVYASAAALPPGPPIGITGPPQPR